MKQILILGACLLASDASVSAQQPSAQPPPRPTASVNTQPRVDRAVLTDMSVSLKTQGIHEQLEGLHDDYYISALIAAHDPNGVRMPERVKAGKFAINGVGLAPIGKTVANGRRIAAFRTEKTVAAIKKAMAAAKAAQ